MERTLRSDDGAGVLRIEERVDNTIGDVWSALTEPARLAQWYGTIEGDLHAGGTYHASLHASGWEGDGIIEVCEPERRISVTGKDPDEPNRHSTEVTLTGDGEQTIVAVEQHGLPVHLLWAYGAGLQIHVEDLLAHLGGRERCNSKVRFEELEPAYRELTAAL